MQFPEETHAVEGEAVLFQVKVTGSPQPKLTWYHNGEEVVADYSRELDEDGSITLPSTEVWHSGTYQLVAQSPAGRTEREVRLFVEAEDTKQRPPTTTPAKTLNAMPVTMFSHHVEQSHARNNRAFRDEFKVCS